eukprot:79303-Pleurochrysis_carterae.AAC.1
MSIVAACLRSHFRQQACSISWLSLRLTSYAHISVTVVQTSHSEPYSVLCEQLLALPVLKRMHLCIRVQSHMRDKENMTCGSQNNRSDGQSKLSGEHLEAVVVLLHQRNGLINRQSANECAALARASAAAH